MKSEHLFEAVGLVDDRLVEEAADARRTAAPWGRWLATAACVLLVLGLGGAAFGTMLRGCGSQDFSSTVPTASNKAASNEAADTDSPLMAEGALAEPAAAPEPSPESGVTGGAASGGASSKKWDELEDAMEPAAMPAPASVEPEETPEAAAEPEPASGEPASDGGIQENGQENAAYEIHALTTAEGEAETLSARRALSLTVNGTETAAADRYALVNTAGDAVTAQFEYPLGAAGGGTPTLSVQVDGVDAAFSDTFELTVPAGGTVTLELSYAVPTGGFALLTESGSGLSLTEQSVEVTLPDGWALETDLPGDPSNGPVAFGTEQARWEIRVTNAG